MYCQNYSVYYFSKHTFSLIQESNKHIKTKLVSSLSSSVPVFFTKFQDGGCNSAVIILSSLLPYKNVSSMRYVYTYIRTYVLICVHTYVRTYVQYVLILCTYIHLRMYVCMYTYVHMYLQKWLKYTSHNLRKYQCMYVCTYVHTYVHISMCVHTYEHVCTYEI